MASAGTREIEPIDKEEIIVAALYKFTPISDLEHQRRSLLDHCSEAGIRGTLLIAPEGINGTIAGSRTAVDNALAAIRTLPGCRDIDHKESRADSMPFQRMKVRIKREIVTMGVAGLDPNDVVGTYVEPEQWNDLITDPDVITIDTRNDYEVAIGSFAGAIDPGTASFGQLPDWIEENLDPAKHRKVAMFCTGGIRCEKATALLRKRGFEEVYHLKGGILKYIEKVPAEQSLWTGACFVFDERVALTHGLQQTGHRLCDTCGRPLEPDAACCCKI